MSNSNASRALRALLGVAALGCTAAWASDYAPTTNTEQPQRLLWGDLHVHSNYSPDAFAFGNTGVTPDDALNFAKGKEIVATNGMRARLSRPLDFLLVADHAEFIGVFPKLMAQAPDFLGTDLGAQWHALAAKAGSVGAIIPEWLTRIQDPNYEQELSVEYRLQVWQEAASIADRHNVPGLFTAFVGYEWTAMLEGNNLHRVVLFRDDAATATQVPPFSALDSKDPEDLWQALASYEEQTGGQVMAIPHNGNISNGMMFAQQTIAGEPIDADYARRRIRWEPLYEVTQVKGDSETHPFLSPDDAFADFETWDDDNIARTQAKTNDMLQHEYARSALRLGLGFEQQLGENPYQFGLMGSTDDHTGLATADDDNFWGKFYDSEPSPQRSQNNMGGQLWDNWRLAASGYTGVWASDNTREALFDALMRKEVYATTGPRIALRFFGGWGYEDEDALASDFVARGYNGGVPMGGELGAGEADRAPRFLVHASKDPLGANLDRVQVIKGWVDEAGATHEKIYNVALSDGREVNAAGEAPALASTVNLEDASYSNSIGAAQWGLMWQDPDFDPSQAAFYYVRVIEIPTPRWTAYDAARFGIEQPEQVPMITQERAYSSPIWYTP